MKYLLIILFVMFGLTLKAQNNDSVSLLNTFKKPSSSDAPFYGVRLFTENDFLSPFAPNLDDNYTGGLKVEFITNRLTALRLGNLFSKDKWDVVVQNVSYGLTVFTPHDLAKPTIITTDRPYASYSFFSMSSAFIEQAKRKKILGYEIFVGEIGSDAGKNFQTKIHKEHWFGTQRPIPQGWQNQIANGGAIAINLRLFLENNIYETKELNEHFKWLQLSWMHELNAGQYLINYAEGLRFNVVNINSVFGSSFSGRQTPVLPTLIQRSSSKLSEQKTAFNFNLYFTPRARLVLHNATLTSKLLTNNSVYTINPSQVVPALFEYDMGLNVRYHFFNAGFNLNGRSREFKYEDETFHNWGGVYVAFIYRKYRH